MRQLAEAAGASVVLSPGALGVLPDAHPQNMHVGGSKGSISGNYAMEKAELVIVIGSRAVCQADCSGVGYKSADMIININGDLADAHHYSNTLALPGDIGLVASALVAELGKIAPAPGKAEWLEACAERKRAWATFKQARYDAESIVDPVWGRKVLTQPAAIKIVDDFARRQGAAKFFDAGDVQANGFQVVEDDRCGDTYTDTGASYMGFAASALLSAAAAKAPRYAIAFCGDGSFMMNPQILIDAVEHHVHATVVIFDNRRMAAITGLQRAQYAHEFRTHDRVAVDYVRLASAVEGVQAIFGGYGRSELNAALETAKAHRGLSVVHVPVYAGEDPLGGLGAFGQWNVGNWCEDVQSEWVNQDF
jgi:3D-(3,5/4)-trihydroxycyclohexane-1,2-dione acylhydrolase (decyclizing)